MVAISKVFEWFHENTRKDNSDKCHFTSSKDISGDLFGESNVNKNSGLKNLLEVTIYRKLDFHGNLSHFYTKQVKKINILA